MPIYRYYPAVFYQDPDSDVGVAFPDFPGCVTAGADENEADDLAIEALQLHIGGMLEDGESIPEPSSLRSAREAHSFETGFRTLVMVRARFPTKAKRINITIDEPLLSEIDEEAAKRGRNRSLFLTEGARFMLSQRDSH